MNAWSGENDDAMGPTVTRAVSAKSNSTPPLKNGSELRETGYLVAVGSETARFKRRHKNKLVVIFLLLLLLLLLCLAIVMTVLYIKQKRHKPIRVCDSKECLRSAANLALSMDRTADPCEDFYQYTCGNWAQDHPRPDSYDSYDWFRDKQTKVYSMVREFLNKNLKDQPKPVRDAKDMYSACMDVATLNKVGLKPVFKLLESVGLPRHPTFINVTEVDYSAYHFDWVETVIKIKVLLGMDVLIGFDIFTDSKNSSVYRLAMGSPEATNPFPSFYNERKKRKRGKIPFDSLKESKESNAFKFIESEEDIAHIQKVYYAELMKLVIESEGKNATNLTEYDLINKVVLASSVYYTTDEDISDLEPDNSTETEEQYDTPDYTVDEIQAHTDLTVEHNNGTVQPIWKRYLEGVFNISTVTLDFETDKFMISDEDLKYLAQMAAYVTKTPPAILELYIWVKVLEVVAIHTTTEIRSLFYRAYYEIQSVESNIPPRSLQCANAVNDMLGMAVTYGIMDPNFVNITKPKIEMMLFELKNALAHLVGQAKWMDENTKLATYQKIIQMKSLVGVPDWLLQEGKLEEHYKDIKIHKKKHLENMINIIQMKIKRALNKFREKHEIGWSTEPTEVNAYHTFQENTIRPYNCTFDCLFYHNYFLDAAIPMVMLQHPFFELGLDSLNYGSLGTILGHEITHGFDNFGRKFDKNGNMLPWWSNETIESFVSKTQCFIDQYSTYYLPELKEHVDGSKTLGENIADNGGLREALLALKDHLRKIGPEPKLPGFEDMTSEQMFFLSYGNLWCGVSTKSSLKDDLDDEHSPSLFRAKGSLQNSEDFARTWRCPVGSTMNPSKRCIIF